MRKIFLFAIIAIATIFTSCHKDNEEFDNIIDSAACQEFVASGSTASLYANGLSFAVDAENDQIAYSEDRTIYMVADMEFTLSYTLDIEGDLLLESTVDIYYSSVGYDGILEEQGSLSMIVANIDSLGNTVWLWSDDQEIGFILYFEPIE